MDKEIRASVENIRSQDKDLRNKAYFQLLEATDEPVGWAYEIWDEMVEGLTHKDNHVRAISAQVLCSLAKSDPKNRMLKDFGKLLAVTRGERFVTARHCMQSLWKVGVAGEKQNKMYMAGLEHRFRECASEKNCTLIRYDIIQSMRNVYEATGNEQIKKKALELIGTETDLKYRKKYASLWPK